MSAFPKLTTVHRDKGVYESPIAQTDEIWPLEEKNKCLFVEEKTNIFFHCLINAVSMSCKWIPTH